MLSNTCKYGVRAVIYLAVNYKEGQKIGIKKISKDLDIPTPFLGKILQSLAKNKLLLSTKGPNGGFELAKNASEINLLDIIKIIDGLDNFQNCLIGINSCSENEVPCPLHSRYAKLRDEIYELFKNQSIESLAEDIRQGNMPINL